MLIVNLGAGTKAVDDPSVVNVDWSIYHRVNRNPALRKIAPLFIRGERRQKLEGLGDNVVVHNLAKGLPFEDATVDAVYHSHFLEHLDRDVAPGFVAEVHRVLRPGGIHRIAVPNLERLCRYYLEDLDASLVDPEVAARHETSIEAVILYSVLREAKGTAGQPPLRRRLENLLLGDARRRGQTHQWMYDRVNLPVLLRSAGFGDVTIEKFNESAIPGWRELALELDEAGNEYKPESLYVECRRL